MIDSATTVRVRDKKPLVTDDPFTEAKEKPASFYMLEARDMYEALRLAEKIPPARYESIEIRPVRDLMAQENQF